jgi:hypothetical protein
MIRGNGFRYDRDCHASVPVAAISAIQATRYASSGAPVESVIIEGNQFTSEIGDHRASSPGAIATAVIDLGEIGAGSAFFPGQSQAFGAVAVRNNVAKAVGSLFLRGVRCVGLVVEGNEVVGIGTAREAVVERPPGGRL